MNIDNIWFYTLSTSAQVLAALAGLFAVFVIWKIQEFEKYISEVREIILYLIPYYSGNITNYKLKRLDDLFFMKDKELLDIFSEILNIKIKEPERIQIISCIKVGKSGISYSLDDRTKYLYEINIKKKEKIIESLKKVLAWNFSIIIICIMSLTFSIWVPNKLLVLIFISFVIFYSLYFNSRSIYKITTE